MKNRQAHCTVRDHSLTEPIRSGTATGAGHNRHPAGQSLVEFALILPILILIVLGIVDFGHAFATRANLVNAAREGARYGMVNPTDAAGICGRVVETASLAHPELSMITVSYQNSEHESGVECIELTCDDEGLDGGIAADQLRAAGDDPGRDRVSVRIAHELSALTPLFQESFHVDIAAARTIARVRE
ncbi:MAG: TadE/TadG family type IV pilus assembly protein [Chloroflexota bacterium]